MRVSQSFIPTHKESPTDAEVVSHKLMVRAGMIRKLAAGIYSILPLGLRVQRKVENIIREEMDHIGGLETFLPSIQPAELWQESGRWDFYGKELLRIKDRHDREFCYGPTHEEVITDLVRKEVKSYRQLPLVFYQIQTKFRDEVRPRFGIMRGREFMMKDAYSFHTDADCARETYAKMQVAYTNIFNRCGLDYRMVEADSGTIGGSFSHEFSVLAESGEDTIGYCESCGYASNLEKTESTVPNDADEGQSSSALEKIKTPNKKTILDVTDFLGVSPKTLAKTIVFQTENEMVAALVRGDHEVNPIKLKNLIDCSVLEPANPEALEKKTGIPCGFIGPVKLDLKIYADSTIPLMKNLIVGGNEKDFHLKGVQLNRDFKIEKSGDIRLAVEGDPCPKCTYGKIRIKRGIEVGHIFILGQKYSSALKANYLDPSGKAQPMEMGCYGIGVGRTAAAAIEQNHDEKGIIWPIQLAPYEAIILPVNYSDETTKEACDLAYKKLWDLGVETLLDDRKDRIGGKFKDADLVGYPLQLVFGPKNLANNQIEIKIRKTGESQLYSFPEVLDKVPEILSSLIG
jgi:prolyl-tRNA synthetase